jgi:dihydroorotate dehydrogenase electron transfer subunit
VIVCAGGVGAAPLLFLTRKLIAKNRVWILIGARTKQELILIPEFRQLGARVLVTTEDGCAGKKGLVTELLTGVVKDLAKPVIYACGPKMMLKGIIEIAGRVQVWGFIEERLGCGAGICYCCGIEKREGGYLRLCQEGPVVDLSRVVL